MMRITWATVAALAAIGMAHTTPAAAQETPVPLAVGTAAPDFSIPGATRYGVLRDPTTLSGFRGKTVVLAFFFRARTGG